MTSADLFDSARRPRILVIGDLMLDRFSYGKVSRVSPEAPVPVLHLVREDVMLGGAANVAANIASLGGEATLIGAVGDDAAGHEFLAEIAGVGPRLSDATVRVPSYPMTVKTRVVAQAQHIVRVDNESPDPLNVRAESLILESIAKEAPRADIICVSDYAKGVLSNTVLAGLFEMAAEAGVPVIVDPKRTDFSVYQGAWIIKPNASELAKATGLPTETDDEAAAAARVVREKVGAAVLLTRSEKGISLFSAEDAPIHVPTTVREVYDVSGAGDTVLAAFSLSIAAGHNMQEAMKIANIAAGIVVSRQGTSTVSAAELMQRRAISNGKSHCAAVSWETAVSRRAEWARLELKVGFTNGCYDLLHPGHISILEQAALACDRLIVGLNTDASVSRLKGPSRPIQDQQARSTVMAALKMVDLVVLFDDDTPLQLIDALQPDVLIKGADYAISEVVGADIVCARGGEVVLAEIMPGQSTSAIVRRMGD